MLNTALKLAATGLAVFPCRVRDKRPATANGCKDATRNPEQIRAWWQTEPRLNVAIATGAVSKIFVVDVDEGGEAGLRKLGILPDSVEAITARGRHIYFNMPDRPIGNSAGRVAPHVDVRGDGGYVLAPPSIHPSGRRYCWSVDSASAFADAPEWLLKTIDADARLGAKDPLSNLAGAFVDEGCRDNTLTRLYGYLVRHYVNAATALDLVRCFNAQRCRPPLPDEDVVRIADSICKRELERRSRDRRDQ